MLAIFQLPLLTTLGPRPPARLISNTHFCPLRPYDSLLRHLDLLPIAMLDALG